MSTDSLHYPETLVFVGAGATASLGMPQSDLQSIFFRALAGRKNEASLENILSDSGSKKIFGNVPPFKGRDLEFMAAFIRFLGDDISKDWYSVDEEDLANGRIVFGYSTDESLLRSRILELRREYDWNGLKQIINICPHDKGNDNLIRDIYTLIDLKIRDKQGIRVYANQESSCIIEPGRLQKVRNCIVLFTNILFGNSWYALSKGERPEIFEKYVKFMESFSRLMQREGADFESRGYKMNSPLFYSMSCAMVSLNFETVFLWLRFNANRKANGNNFYLSQSARKLETWVDFGLISKRRDISSDPQKRKEGIYKFSQIETSIYRSNGIDSPGVPIGRIGAFFFAHGCCNWRECPSCGRMMYYLGDKWEYKSSHLNPPFPIPLFENNVFNRTPREKEWKGKLRYDSLECISCGSETIASNAPMIMQTMIKGIPTSFLDEVQRETRVLLGKARHIVLLGYQLPPDDILWQEAFAESVRSRKNSENGAYCSVIVGHLGRKCWIYGDEMMQYAKAHRYEKDASGYGANAIVNAVSIFGKEYVRAYCGGIPDVFGDGSETGVKTILYPEWVNWKETRLN